MIPPILITGCARSGTSMTAGIFQLCGAFGGEVSGPNRHNKRGMFENVQVREGIVKPYLRSIGMDALGQWPLPDIDNLVSIDNLKEQVESLMISEGYSSGAWYVKQAKFCLIWTAIIWAFPNAKWIIVRRTDEDIINSCLKTTFMRAFSDAPGWQKWIDVHKQRFEEMKKAGLLIKEVWPSKYVAGDFSEIKEAVEWAGLSWNEKEVLPFVEPALWSQNRRDSHG
jgi:hypothetical protein